MRKLLTAILFFASHLLPAQITLKECIESGLANKATIRSATAEVVLSELKSADVKAKYLPQLTLAYDYRYNPKVPAQIVPVGQFNPVPTDETRAIRFGTAWQQNAGVTLYQPIIDLALSSRIKESKLNESLSNLDKQKAEDDLVFEIFKTYSNVLTRATQLNEAVADTARSAQSFQIVAARFREGKVLKTEFNNARVNHMNNLRTYRSALASLLNEKIYLRYLTNIPIERLFDEVFSPIPTSVFASDAESTLQLDSVPEYQRFALEVKVIDQQLRTDRRKYVPTVGVQGFVGASQFSQQFDPFLQNSWFGNSYIGLSARLPLFATDKSINANRQLKTQSLLVSTKRDEWKAQREREILQKDVEVRRLQDEVSIASGNLTLLKENVAIYRDRLSAGQFAAVELNVQESELQKASFQLQQLEQELNRAKVERLYLAGRVGERLKKL